MSGRNYIVVTSGGASMFLKFICDELIPFIESNYRVDSQDRAILGYSHGGLFTLYVLFHSPGTFQRYFAGSPSIWWDNTILFKYENEYASTHKDLPAKLFICAGSLESEPMLENMNKMSKRLRSRNYPSLELETYIFENETHASCYAGAISRALRVIYK
jgi:predicted alpha/beta superfamily hydrolase